MKKKAKRKFKFTAETYKMMWLRERQLRKFYERECERMR